MSLKKLSYIYYPASHDLGIPTTRFYSFNSFALSRELNPPVVLADNRAKINVDADLIVGENTIEYTN